MTTELQKIPFVDGTPENGQSSIEWINNGDRLMGASEPGLSDGNLNNSISKVQKNVVVVDSNTKILAQDVSKNETDIQNIYTILNQGQGTDLIQRVSQNEDNITELDQRLSQDEAATGELVSGLLAMNERIGVKDAADVSSRTLSEDTFFMRKRIGNKVGENIDGEVDTSIIESTGIFKNIDDTIAKANFNSAEIDDIKQKMSQTDIPGLTQSVAKMRIELGPEPTATIPDVYARLTGMDNHNTEVDDKLVSIQNRIGPGNVGQDIDTLKAEVDQLQNGLDTANTNIGILDTAIGDPATGLNKRITDVEASTEDLESVVFDPATGLEKKVNDIITEIGNGDVPDSIKGRINNLENDSQTNSSAIQNMQIDVNDLNLFKADQVTINLQGGAKYTPIINGYNLNERVVLNTGDIVKSTVAGNSNNPNINMTGWTNIDAASEIIDSSGRSQQNKNDDFLNLKDYISYVVADDWTKAIQKADDDAILKNKSVTVPGGTYNYNNDITLKAHWFGSGLHCTRFRKTAPATITQLNGSIRDLTISPDSQLPSDTTPGIIADGVDRKFILNVLTEKHGGDGFIYKRGNLSRFFLRSRSNGGRGVTFANDTISGDNKACEVWFECSANKKSGFYIEQHATNDVYNSSSNFGMIMSQNNGSDAISKDNYGVVLSGNGHNFTIYAEYNNASVWHRDKLKASNIFYSNMSYPTFLDEANDTNVVSYIPSALGSRATKAQKFETIIVHNENSSYSGKLALSHTANNTFRFDATLSGAQQYLELPSNLTLRGAGNSYQFAKASLGGATLNFGSIPPQGQVEKTITVPGAVTSLQTAVISTPAGDIGANLAWNSWVSAFDANANTTTVTIRVLNHTSSAIVSNSLAWRVQIIT